VLGRGRGGDGVWRIWSKVLLLGVESGGAGDDLIWRWVSLMITETVVTRL
jgi:hypothetical protein